LLPHITSFLLHRKKNTGKDKAGEKKETRRKLAKVAVVVVPTTLKISRVATL
jgi:hypothetical protein